MTGVIYNYATSMDKQTTAAPGFGGLEGKRVLIADDVMVNQFILKHILESWKIRTDTVSNGRDVLEKLRQEYYDLILMDIEMPLMDGTAATQEIRRMEDPVKSATPVIALTAHILKGDNQSYLDAGMNDYIAKPYTAEKLYQVISGLVSGRPLYDLSMLSTLSNGDSAFIAEVVTLFLEAAPEDLARLNEAVDLHDHNMVSRMAHKMKSSIDSLGIASLAEPVRLLEQAAATGNSEQTEALRNQMNHVMNHVFKQLRERSEHKETENDQA